MNNLIHYTYGHHHGHLVVPNGEGAAAYAIADMKSKSIPVRRPEKVKTEQVVIVSGLDGEYEIVLLNRAYQAEVEMSKLKPVRTRVEHLLSDTNTLLNTGVNDIVPVWLDNFKKRWKKI
jgi:hypothetical protein